MANILLGIAIGFIIGLIVRDWLEPKKPFESNVRWLSNLEGSHQKLLRLPLSPEKTRLIALRVIRNQPLTYKALTPQIMTRVELLKVRKELAKRELISKGIKGEIIPTPPLIEFFREELICSDITRNEMIIFKLSGGIKRSFD